MTLSEAIEILNYYWRHPMHSPTVEQLDAIKLGIEALKDLQQFDKIRGRDARLLLPGETEE